MIIGDIKPLSEIQSALRGVENVLILGCRGCVTVCSVGGEKEVDELAALLNISKQLNTTKCRFTKLTIERQCDPEFIEPIQDIIRQADIVLSLACGAGVQLVAEYAIPTMVIPGINTTFIGANLKPDTWVERCQACGDCILEITGGICPIS